METASRHRATLTLPSDKEIVLVRDFDAPKRAVFAAWSTPELVRRWYGCPDMDVPVCELDFREGGQWRIVLTDQDRVEHRFSGEYREIAQPDRLVFTERYEAFPDGAHLVTLTFVGEGSITRQTLHILHATAENRDAHLRTGMESGLEQMFTRLEAAVAPLTPASR